MKSLLSRILKYRKKVLSPGDVAELCKTNSVDAYDLFWGDEALISAYLEPARLDSYMTVVNMLREANVCGSKIVDLGFGSGDFLKLLVQSRPECRFEIYGLDYSKKAVSRAKKIIPMGHFITGDIYKLPYEYDFFDTVFCIQTLEHLRHPELVVKEMDRICKASGTLVITIPNGEFDSYEGHVNFWSEAEFKRFLEPHNILRFESFNENRVFLAILRPVK